MTSPTHPTARAAGLRGSLQDNCLALYRARHHPDVIAAMLGISLSAVYWHIRPALLLENREATITELRERVADLWNDGRSVEGIAMETGCTVAAVSRMLQRLRKEGWKLAEPFYPERGSGARRELVRAAFAVMGTLASAPRFFRKTSVYTGGDWQGGGA